MAAYVDDYIEIRVQDGSQDLSALDSSASLASDHLRLFGPGLEGETPILAPKKSTNWDVELEFLGWKLNTHTGRLSLPPEKVEATAAL